MNPERPSNLDEIIQQTEQKLGDIHQRKLELIQQLADKVDKRELKDSRQEIEQHD